MYGKSIFSWNVPAVNSDPEKFTKILLDMNFEAVCLKAADGIGVHKSYKNGSWSENVTPELVRELKDAGLKVYLWQFVYGYNPTGELNVALKQTDRFEPDGYIWDAEGSFDSKSNAVGNARTLTRGYKAKHPHVRQNLCWWALPKSPTTGNQWHPIPVAQAFLEVCDSAMPMMYWQGAGGANAMWYLNTSLRIWRTFTTKPIIPVGRVYNGDGGYASPEAILAFANSALNSAETMNLIGTSWWSLDRAVQNPSWMAALKQTPRFAASTMLTTEEILERLMDHHQSLFPEVYPPGN